MKPYKLASREFKADNTVVNVDGVEIGGGRIVIMAGPCAVESEEQVIRTARAVRATGAHILRGGAFKPSTSPYTFRGLGEEGLKHLAEASRLTGLPVVTEVRGENQVDLIAEFADILQIGARNMYDQDLLTTVARKQKPVLFKRHFGAGVEEFLSFAEYIAAEGNKDAFESIEEDPRPERSP
jgi:3-deoxy-7-phosphoheptulonate synthase